jgi:hypothetical protein
MKSVRRIAGATLYYVATRDGTLLLLGDMARKSEALCLNFE